MIVYVIMTVTKLFLKKTSSDVKWVKFLYQAKLYKTETNARKVMEEVQLKTISLYGTEMSIVKVVLAEEND